MASTEKFLKHKSAPKRSGAPTHVDRLVQNPFEQNVNKKRETCAETCSFELFALLSQLSKFFESKIELKLSQSHRLLTSSVRPGI